MTRDLSTINPARGWPGAWRTLLLALFLLVPIADVQFWISTAGWAAWSRGSKYVSLMADAFDHGQFSLMIRPPPELLALPDPYDPQANAKYRLHDALLFNGKYYLYWGPAPALITAAVCRVLGLTPDFSDQYLVFAFAFGTVLALFCLAVRARAKFFPDQSLATVAVPVVSLGLGTPLLFVLARPAVYEAAICAGQFFLLSGFCAAFHGLSRLDSHRASAARWLTMAGILWALSIGSRVSLIPGVAAAEAVTLFFLFRDRRRSMWAAAGMAAPFLAAIVLLGYYNYARFHSFTEFGLRWQLAGLNGVQSPGDLFRLRYILVNAYCYLLASPVWTRGFPFVYADGRLPPLARFVHLPNGFRVESVVGLAWSQPIFIFAILGVAMWWWRKVGAPFPTTNQRGNRSLATWLTTSLCAAGLVGFAPAVVFETVTMRYLLDAVPCLTMLAALGYWRLLDSPSLCRRWMVNAAVVVLLAGQSILGLLMAVSGYYGNFQYSNPRLFHSMELFFNRL